MTVSKYLKLSESAQYKTPPSTSHEDLENQFWNTFMHNPPIYGADILKTLFDSKCEVCWTKIIFKKKPISHIIHKDHHYFCK